MPQLRPRHMMLNKIAEQDKEHLRKNKPQPPQIPRKNPPKKKRRPHDMDRHQRPKQQVFQNQHVCAGANKAKRPRD